MNPYPSVRVAVPAAYTLSSTFDARGRTSSADPLLR